MVCNENNEERAPIGRKRASITTINRRPRSHSFGIVCLSSLFFLFSFVFLCCFSPMFAKGTFRAKDTMEKMRENPVFLCWSVWIYCGGFAFCACFRRPPPMIDWFVWCWLVIGHALTHWHFCGNLSAFPPKYYLLQQIFCSVYLFISVIFVFVFCSDFYFYFNFYIRIKLAMKTNSVLVHRSISEVSNSEVSE